MDFEPRQVKELPPPNLELIGTFDGRGRMVARLFRCTIVLRSGTSMTIRFGAADETDGREGAQEIAGYWFEEMANEILARVPTARPHPDDTTVQIRLLDEVTGTEQSYFFDIPPDMQPNSGSAGPAFYQL